MPADRVTADLHQESDVKQLSGSEMKTEGYGEEAESAAALTNSEESEPEVPEAASCAGCVKCKCELEQSPNGTMSVTGGQPEAATSRGTASSQCWGEMPTLKEPSSHHSDKVDVRTGILGEVTSGEDEACPHTPSPSSSSVVSSPAVALDDVEVEGEETGVEDSEEERCATPPFPVLPSRPVKGESFCSCYQNGGDSGLYCTCGEEDSVFEWVWEEKTKSSASFLKQDLREVLFHVDFSCGTAGVRGSKPMTDDQYYWEVKMTTPVYGTDMMVGVGTGEVDLEKYRHMFCSLLGKDGESWGLSYSGVLQHKSLKKSYSTKFGQGTIIGVHLDMWRGTLSFFKNRKPLGVAYTGLNGKAIYPMVCSTAARSGMKVIRCCSFRTSLQFMCCQVLRRIVPLHCDVLEAVKLPPGLHTFLCNNVGWLLQPSPLESPDKGASEVLKRKRTFSDVDEPREGANKRLRPSYRY